MRIRLFVSDRTASARTSRHRTGLVAGAAALGVMWAVWMLGLGVSLQWAVEPDAKPVAASFRHLSVAGHATAAPIKADKGARPGQNMERPEAPDFVREAWARDAAKRQRQQQVASAFETRFVTLDRPKGAITGEQFAKLVRANQEAAKSKAAQLAQAAVAAEAAEPVAPVEQSREMRMAAVEQKELHADVAEDLAAEVGVQVASLEPDLPEQGVVPSWRPAIARKATIAVQEPAVAREPAAAPVLAFARPDNPAERPAAKSALIPWPGLGRKTAVYDVSNAVVYMPNGEKLEAHSGRGKLRDNPKYSHVKMRGATPASTYKLTMREARFHGVEAIRLNPIDGKPPKGRTGLLAHTYLLRVPGDSSGCVVFKNYPRFLAAFKRGEIDHMVVVDRLEQAPRSSAPRIAGLFGHRG